MTSIATSATTATTPFVGPVALGANDEIFGRDREIGDVRDVLVAERILLLYSPSGAGKTSLLEAGLRRRLTADGFTVLPRIRVAHELPAGVDSSAVDNRYRLSCLLQLDEAFDDDPTLDESALSRVGLEEYLQRRCGPSSDEQCLFFDQFEELFTTDPTDEDAKADFVRELGEVLADKGRWAVFSMREDFIAQLDPYLKLLPTRLRSRYRLDLLRPAAARVAILRPGARQDVRFAEDAADRLVEDLRMVQIQRDGEKLMVPGPYIEPVQLQVVCLRLWQQLAPTATEITSQHVSEFGDIDNALAGFYDVAVEHVASVTGVGEGTIRWWVGRDLVTEHGFRNQVLEGPGDAGDQVLQELESCHVLRAERRRDALWYELAHDRLVAPINESNQTWTEQHLSLLQRTARLWHDARRPEHLLLSGDHLREAKTWAQSHPEQVEPVDSELLAASVRGARRQRNVQRAVQAALLVGALAVLASAVAVWKWQEANDRRDRAVQTERGLDGYVASQASGLSASERLLFDRRALASYSEGQAVPPFIARSATTHLHQASRTAWSANRGFYSMFTAISGDGSTLARSSTSTGVQVISLDGTGARHIDLGGEVYAVALSSDGALVAAAVVVEWPAARIAVFRTEDGGQLREFDIGDVLSIYSGERLVFSPDDRSLATTIGGMGVFDVASGDRRSLPALEELDPMGLDVADNGAVVAWNAGGLVRVVDLATGNIGFEEDLGAGDEIVQVTTSDDGAQIAVLSFDARVTLVDVASGSRAVLALEAGPVAVMLDSAGRLVAIDYRCMLTTWEGERSVATQPLATCSSGEFQFGFHATFSPDHSVVATALDNGVVHAWRVDTGELVYSSALAAGAAVSNELIAGMGPGGRLVVTDLQGRQRWSRDIGDPVRLIALNENNDVLLAATRDRLVRLDAATGAEIERSASLPSAPERVAVSGDGFVAAAVTGDRLWRWAADGTPKDVRLPTESVTALSATYYGGNIYVGTTDGTIVVSEDGDGVLDASDPDGPGGVKAIAADTGTDLIAVAGGGGESDDYVDVFRNNDFLRPIASLNPKAEPTAVAIHDGQVVVTTVAGVDVFDIDTSEMVGGYDLAAPSVYNEGYGYDRPVSKLSETPGEHGYIALSDDGFTFAFPVEPAELIERIDAVTTAAGSPELTPELCERAGARLC